MYLLNDIQKKEELCYKYLKELKLNRPINEIIKQSHELCPELKKFCIDNENNLKKLSNRDKGNLGKYIEFMLFGILPNSKQETDLPFADIKTTTFKKFKDIGINAKERLTITNCGCTENYDTFDKLKNLNKISEYEHYKKIQKGILFINEHTNEKYNSLEDKLNTKMLKICIYDIEKMSEEHQNQIQMDLEDIQTKIKTQTVSQKGQKCLHIHPHGSKSSKTRALGFTNKFLTMIVSHFCNLPLEKKGNSLYIKK